MFSLAVAFPGLGSSFWLVVVLELSLEQWVHRNTISSVIWKDVRRPVGHQHVDAPAAVFCFVFVSSVFGLPRQHSKEYPSPLRILHSNKLRKIVCPNLSSKEF